ncbi:MAG TPA: hypothetical protein VF232_02470 [Gaiellaceae bacterium]
MSLRRVFLLGAAALASVAALVAIVTVVSGDFGETEGRIFATIATTFAAGSALVAGLALLGRRESPLLGYAGIGLALTGFVLWSAQIWGEFAGEGYWKLVGVLTAWSVAVLVVTTTRLMLSSPSLVRGLYPATGAAAGGAALVATVMILRESGDGWQLFAVLLILALLAEVLAPILERYGGSRARPAERLLGVVGGVEVVAVNGGNARLVRVGDASEHLDAGESVVVRARS